MFKRFCLAALASTGLFAAPKVIAVDIDGVIHPITVDLLAHALDQAASQNAAAVLLRKAAGVEKGSGVPNREKVGKVTHAQVREIAQLKMKDMNALDIEGAMRQIEGTARNMGITIVD